MNLLPFDNLPAYKPRAFVPTQIDLGDWKQLGALFDQLETLGAKCVQISELEHWLVDWSELTAALDEEKSRRYITMTCHTDNTDAEKAYIQFVEHVDSRAKLRQARLEKLFVGHPLQAKLPMPRYEVFLRNTQTHLELFREQNVALETEEARLSQQYEKLSGSLTVHFRGEERTLMQMGKLLELPVRAMRQEAWELVERRRMQERETFEHLFDELLRIRECIAANAGFGNYRDYAFRKKCRVDYTPQDCERFHDAVAREVIPVLRELQAQRCQHLGLKKLRPWDLAVDSLNRPPLKPFEEIEQMVSRTQQIFDKLDNDLAANFRRMQKLRLLDLANRKAKAPGGYQCTLAESRLPFIFMNAVGQQRDVSTILHEAGHAFHALAARDEDLLPYRNSPPLEFCEVASMSMELLGNEFIEEFYSRSDANRARRSHLEEVIGLLARIAMGDAFQHWIYTHPGHTRTDRDITWNSLIDRFAGNVDWSGHEEARAHLWHRQLHFFILPFYFIEYGIGQIGALQVWANAKNDQSKTLADYKKSLTLGGSRPLPELFAAAGCRFQFGAVTIKEIVELLRCELRKLD